MRMWPISSFLGCLCSSKAWSENPAAETKAKDNTLEPPITSPLTLIIPEPTAALVPTSHAPDPGAADATTHVSATTSSLPNHPKGIAEQSNSSLNLLSTSGRRDIPSGSTAALVPRLSHMAPTGQSETIKASAGAVTTTAIIMGQPPALTPSTPLAALAPFFP